MPEIKNIRYNNRAQSTTGILKNAERVLDTSVTQFIKGTPIECDYYSYDSNASSVGVGFRDDDGPFSGARKYNYIKDYIMYGFNSVKEMTKEDSEELDFSYKIADNMSVHLPNTINPKEGDLLTLHIENNSLIYIVTKAEKSTLHNHSFIKTEWNLCDNLPYENYSHSDMVKDGLIINEYKFVPENVGTDYTCILRSDFWEKIQIVKDFRSELNDLYMDYFYDEDRNILTVDEDFGIPKRVYIPLLNDLQMEFKPLYVFGVNMVLHHEILINKRTKVNWKKNLIRKFIKDKNPSILTDEGITFNKWIYATDPESPHYKLQSYLNDGRFYEVYDYGDNNNKINIPLNFKNIFYNYIDNKIKLNTLIEEIRNEEYEIDINEEYLLFTPVLLYIIDDFLARCIANEKPNRFY